MSVADHSEVCDRVATAALCSPMPGTSISLWDAAKAGLPYYGEGPHIDPMTLLNRAARGDLNAMRDFSGQALCAALSGRIEYEPIATLTEGLILARMASVIGNDEDEMKVVVMLSIASLFATGADAVAFAGEALARLELLADGDNRFAEFAAELLAVNAERESPDTLACAQRFRALLARPETD